MPVTAGGAGFSNSAANKTGAEYAERVDRTCEFDGSTTGCCPMDAKKKRTRTRRSAKASSPTGSGLPAPLYLAEKLLPLARAMRLAIGQLSELRTPDKFSARLDEIEENAKARMKKMLTGTSERAALEALKVVGELRRIHTSREAAAIRCLNTMLGAATSLEIAKLNTQVHPLEHGKSCYAPPLTLADIVDRPEAGEGCDGPELHDDA